MATNYSNSLPVKIGSGSEFVTTTVMGTRTLLDVSVANNTIAGMPYVNNILMPLADTEYSFNLFADTKQIMFKTRENSLLKFTFQAGQSNTNYITVPPGTSYTLSGVDPTIALVLYFQSTQDNETLEIISWV